MCEIKTARWMMARSFQKTAKPIESLNQIPALQVLEIRFEELANSVEIHRILFENVPKTSRSIFLVSLGSLWGPGPPKSHLNGSRFDLILAPFWALGSVHFSYRFLEIPFEPRGCHRECQGCVQAPERGTKSTPRVAMEVSEGMSENHCFTTIKPWF